MKACEQDVKHLERLYEGRRPYHGEMHDHAATGGTSDGKCTLAEWIERMKELELDFAAILDHAQVRHMYQPEWKDGLFVGGTEPGTRIKDDKTELHYNMVFAAPEPLEKILTKFEEFQFTGGSEGHFKYPDFMHDRFCELIDSVKEAGGFFVHPHPKQAMVSDNPIDYWFRDETGLEVFYRDMRNRHTERNYELWTTLLAMDKRIWACAGGDGHREASDAAITTIYAEKYSTQTYLDHLREGDFICGSVGIRMCMGDTRMGGKCDFAGKRLVFAIGDFHKSVRNSEHQYRVVLLNDEGVVCSQEISCMEPAYFAIDAEACKFYRVEVFDETENLRIAIGNPIWNISKRFANTY